MKLSRIAAMAGKEGREIIRDRITLGIALLMPLMMLFLFGYAISLDVDNVPFGVLDLDRGVESRALAESFIDSGYFYRAATFRSGLELEQGLRTGRVTVAIVITDNFGSRLARGESAPVQVIVDGTYSATANLAAAYAKTIIAAFTEPAKPAVRVETRVWYNPEMKSVTYVVPGLFGVILMALPPLLTALAITREKERGTIQQIFASPLTPAEFLAGKLIPYGLVAFLQIFMVMVVGFLWFEVPLQGNLALLLGVGLIYVFCTVGIGLLVSTVTGSQLVAMLLAMIVTMMPSFLFSGFLFPIFTMPYALQLYSRLFPTRYFVDFSRGVVLKGAGLPELWPSVALLLAYTVVIFCLAVWRLPRKVA